MTSEVRSARPVPVGHVSPQRQESAYDPHGRSVAGYGRTVHAGESPDWGEA